MSTIKPEDVKPKKLSTVFNSDELDIIMELELIAIKRFFKSPSRNRVQLAIKEAIEEYVNKYGD